MAQAVTGVADALAALPAPGMIIGGIAVILHGVPRVTRDVDGTVDAGSIEIEALASHLGRYQIVARIEDAVAFAKANQVLLLRHEPTWRLAPRMTVARFTISMDAKLAREVRKAAGTTPVSAWLADAAVRKLRAEGLRRVVAEWEGEHGELTKAELQQAARKHRTRRRR